MNPTQKTNCTCRNCGHKQLLFPNDLMTCEKCKGCLEKDSWNKPRKS